MEGGRRGGRATTKQLTVTPRHLPPSPGGQTKERAHTLETNTDDALAQKQNNPLMSAISAREAALHDTSLINTGHMKNIQKYFTGDKDKGYITHSNTRRETCTL